MGGSCVERMRQNEVSGKGRRAEGQRVHIGGIHRGLYFSTVHTDCLYNGDSSLDLTQALINELMFMKLTMIFRLKAFQNHKGFK